MRTWTFFLACISLRLVRTPHVGEVWLDMALSDPWNPRYRTVVDLKDGYVKHQEAYLKDGVWHTNAYWSSVTKVEDFLLWHKYHTTPGATDDV